MTFEEEIKEVLVSKVDITDIDASIYKNFDFDFDGSTSFEVPMMPRIDEEFSIGVIFGSSGSGKSTLLKRFGEDKELEWNPNNSVASHFDSEEDAIARLSAVGLNTVPSWAKPRHVLSNGEGFRQTWRENYRLVPSLMSLPRWLTGRQQRVALWLCV
jgi:hypothetical protein